MTRKYFGTDGIRDVAGEGLLSPRLLDVYGRAVGRWLAERRPEGRVLVGRDTRASGPMLLARLAAGLDAAGLRIVDGGVLGTPAVQALCREEGFDLAVVISASHNPAADNGIKFFGPDGRKLPDAEEMALETLIEEEASREAAREVSLPASVVADEAAAARYEAALLERFPNLDLTGVKVVVDAAHGAAYRTAPRVLEALGATVAARGVAPDGTNINAESGVYATDALAEAVRREGAALGLALDGDADRALLVDETGVLRDGDQAIGVLATDLDARGELPGHRVVATVMSNLGLLTHLRGLGIEVDLVPVGDRHVAEGMANSGAVLGGEPSGHVIFREGARWSGDGLYTALRVLEVMRRRGESLSGLAGPIPKFPQVLVNVRVKAKTPVEEVAPLVQARRDAERKMGEEGRVLLRYSGTEPLLRVMVEGKDADSVRALADDLAAVAAGALG